MDWFEELPDDCPPKSAEKPNSDYFRLVANNPANENDFKSHRARWPKRKFNTTECRARSLSVFSDISGAEDLKKLPRHKSKTIVKLSLTQEMGLVEQTGRNKLHHSWWRTSEADIFNSIEYI